MPRDGIGERLFSSEPRSGYLPIEDYALIGDCHGAALVGYDGSVDWWCRERFDEEPTLWRLLDKRKGPCFGIAPAEGGKARRAYLPDTNILRTDWTVQDGRFTVTDFLPVGRAPNAEPDDFVTLSAPGWLVRIVEGQEGQPRARIRLQEAALVSDRRERSTKQSDLRPESGISLCWPLRRLPMQIQSAWRSSSCMLPGPSGESGARVANTEANINRRCCEAL